MKRFTITGFLVLILSITAWVPARGNDWAIDADHSTIQFRIKHIFSTVFGYFPDFDGTIHFDPENLDQSKFDFTVQVKTINTAIAKRDTHLRSDDFFAADTYPVMTFTSSKITHKQNNAYEVSGTMTIKDIAKEMNIPFVFHGTAPSPFDKKQIVAGFDTAFSLDRLAFGVGDGKFFNMGVVGDVVDVTISVEALRTP